jgi:hypothetical protein
MAGFTWQVRPDRAWGALAANYRAAIERGIVGIANRWAPEIENYMKANAPWTDRTGNARQGLYTAVNHAVGSMVEIILSHGVDYGYWLEVKNGGAYAVVNPALDYFGPRIWADVRRMLS